MRKAAQNAWAAAERNKKCRLALSQPGAQCAVHYNFRSAGTSTQAECRRLVGAFIRPPPAAAIQLRCTTHSAGGIRFNPAHHPWLSDGQGLFLYVTQHRAATKTDITAELNSDAADDDERFQSIEPMTSTGTRSWTHSIRRKKTMHKTKSTIHGIELIDPRAGLDGSRQKPASMGWKLIAIIGVVPSRTVVRRRRRCGQFKRRRKLSEG